MAQDPQKQLEQALKDIDKLQEDVRSLHDRLKLNEQSGLVPVKVRDLDKVLYQETTYNPPNLASLGQTSTTLTVNSANFGDWVLVSAPYSLQGIVVQAYVSAVNTVTINLFNATSGAIDLASGTWRVMVIRRFY